jgi:flagellar protein FliL
LFADGRGHSCIGKEVKRAQVVAKSSFSFYNEQHTFKNEILWHTPEERMAKEEQAPAEATAEGGSKKKLFIIIGAAVLVLVIAGVVVFMMMGKGDKKKEGADAHGAPAAADGGHGAAAPAAGGHGGAAVPGASTVFSLEPFIVNIYDGQELRYLKVKVELEMSNAGIKAELDGRLAAIRDAILVVLTTKTLQEVQDAQGKNQLREEILTAISKIVAQGKVTKVYFTDFVVQ